MDFAVAPLDDRAQRAAVELSDRLTKPRGALGHLEVLGAHLAGISGQCPPPVPERPMVAVFAGDHGVVAEGVTPWPQEVTGQMVANLCAGGAAVNVLARQVGAGVVVVDVGVATILDPAPGLRLRNVRRGTDNLGVGAAMTSQDVDAALDVGASIAAELIAAGADLLITGEMGIGNTTPSAAVIGALTGAAAADVTGRGTGIDDATLDRKREVVAGALARLGNPRDTARVLAEVGGLELAALTGYCIAGAAAGVPVVVDGVIALAGLLAADSLAPGTAARCIAGHLSTEPGAAVALAHLGMRPVLDLGLRLGEGTGAVLAVPVIQAAARVLNEMATFDGAGVTDKDA